MAFGSAWDGRTQRGRLALGWAVLLSACALLKSTPEDTPPEAPSAMEFRYLSPAMRDAIMPPPAVFQGFEYADRLICQDGEHPNWKRTVKKGMVETYEVQCPGGFSDTVVLDTASVAPPAPAGYRLLSDQSFPEYRDALVAGEKKDFSLMLAELDAALKKTPDELVYRRERIYALYSLGRPLEALLQADDLLKVFPNPLVYRYRAVAARQLGMRDVVLSSLDGIVSLTKPGNPLYAEAICAKGIVLAGEGAAAGVELMKQGCALDYQACCDELKAREKAAESTLQSSPETEAPAPPPPADSAPATDGGTPQATPPVPASPPQAVTPATPAAI